MRWDLPRTISIPNLKFLALVVPNLRKGFKILKFCPDHALVAGILSSMRWNLPRSIRVPNFKFLASPVPKIRLGARGGVPKLARGPRCIFYLIHTKFGVNIVEWSMLNTNVLDFRYIFALSNDGANCLQLGMKNDANFGFFCPIRFRGHFEEIGIAKVVLETNPRRVEKLQKCRFFDV